MWQHRDPANASLRYSDRLGRSGFYIPDGYNAELDMVGADMALENPYPTEVTLYEPRDEFAPYWLLPSNPFSGRCTLDGLPIQCNDLSERMEAGWVAMEYLIPNVRQSSNGPPVNRHRDDPGWGGGEHRGWARETYDIYGWGLGLFEVGHPLFHSDSDDEGYDTGRAFGSFSHSPLKGGKRVPLSGPTADVFKFELRDLLFLLDDPESDCAQFLKRVFDFNASRVAKAVRGMRAFDGDASTLTMGAAGLTPYRDPKTGKRNDDAYVPVNEYFRNRRINGWPAAAMYAGFSRRTARDIYFSPVSGLGIDMQTILHEVLHMFSGLNDQELADKLGVDITNGSQAISDALRDGGCGN